MTTTAIEVAPKLDALAKLTSVAERAKEYASASRAEATLRAYALQWQSFTAWCDEHGVPALPAPPALVAMYAAQRADDGDAVASIELALAAVSQAHKLAGLPSPRSSREVRETLRGIKRVRAAAGIAQRQAVPLGPAELRRMVEGEGLAALRDRSLLLLGFAAALRRRELVERDVCDVQRDADGLIVRIGRSKTDQEGAGRSIGIPFGSDPTTCPVRALRDWLEASGITAGAIFRGVRGGKLTEHRLAPGDVSRIVKRCARRVGLDVELLSGHSLRSGLATSAAKAGKPLAAIQAQTGHKSVAMVSKYVRLGTLLDGSNAAAGIGL